ncbi:helix-turn-helix transcriptional regulator [Actinosynnema sp. NPDC050436]|uniref:helix-turn-helix domain-containing protein n=1 Tax=Actinosynnema sp. NPDC050436 TaxID=3155659 RepID=UPI0033D6FFEC
MAEASALSWLIGNELREHRDRARKKGTEAAKVIGCTSGKISQIEAGMYRQRPDEVALLLGFYGADRADIDRVVALASQDDESTWWGAWTDVVPDWFRTFVGLERLASTEFTYEPIVLPALLQTEAYATAVTAFSRRVRPDRGDRVVHFRMERQRRLTEPARPLELHAIIEESALHRPVGDDGTMRGQLAHLLELGERSTVEIQVIRTSVGVHSADTGPFVLLGFDNFRDAVYVELQEGALNVQDPAQVRAYSMSAKNLREAALSRRESRSLIASRLKDL